MYEIPPAAPRAPSPLQRWVRIGVILTAALYILNILGIGWFMCGGGMCLGNLLYYASGIVGLLTLVGTIISGSSLPWWLRGLGIGISLVAVLPIVF